MSYKRIIVAVLTIVLFVVIVGSFLVNTKAFYDEESSFVTTNFEKASYYIIKSANKNTFGWLLDAKGFPFAYYIEVNPNCCGLYVPGQVNKPDENFFSPIAILANLTIPVALYFLILNWMHIFSFHEFFRKNKKQK